MFELELNSRSFRDCPEWQQLHGAKPHLADGSEREADDTDTQQEVEQCPAR